MIKVAIVGLGNCASSLIQGVYYYKQIAEEDCRGLMHWNLGGYTPGDIEIVLAVDIDKRKVGRDISEAIYAQPNCTRELCKIITKTGVSVMMGKVLDGYPYHMEKYPEDERFLLSDADEVSEDKMVEALVTSGAEVLVNFLPVGSEKATYFYMDSALKSGISVVNAIPVFIASNPLWQKKFFDKKLALIGDDVKSQVGATIIHRFLAELLQMRGVTLKKTYQLNVGGNTDFLNMLDRSRLASKKESKTEAIQSILRDRLPNYDIHISPSDYVPWQKDKKVCFIRIEADNFGDSPVEIELRLSVEDSPNSACVVMDAIRCCKVAIDRGAYGALTEISAAFMKHPPQNFDDREAHHKLEKFINNEL